MTAQHGVPAPDKRAPLSPNPAQRYVIRKLRKLVSQHDAPTSWREAERIASAQASRLLWLADLSTLDVVDFVRSLPAVQVHEKNDLPLDYLVDWLPDARHWQILIRHDASFEEQRFDVLRGFKLILDHGLSARLYDPRNQQGSVQAEMAANYFASCTLMPVHQVRAALRDGAMPGQLATQFRVTEEAVLTRLSELNQLPQN